MMTPEAQRIAIAEACSLIKHEKVSTRDGDECMHCGISWHLRNTNKCNQSELRFPDYLNDLNAMHEAEMQMQSQHWAKYQEWLIHCSVGKTGHMIFTYCATAAQRAESFLRTIGKWVD